MKYYKIIENGIITQLHGGSIVPEGQAEISKEEYDAILEVIRNKPEDTLEEIFELTEEGYVGRARTTDEVVGWYVQAVQGGMDIAEVPAEYQEAVQAAMPEEEVSEYDAGYNQAVLDMIESGVL